MKNKILCFFILAIIAMSGSALRAQEKKAEGNPDDSKIIEAIKDIYRRLELGVKIYADWTMKWGQKDSGPGAPYGNSSNTGAGSGAFDRVVKDGNGSTSLANLSSLSNGTDYEKKNNNGFNISRAYLDAKYKINDILSVRLTSDVDAGVTGAADNNAAFHLFLKFAYLEAKKDFGPIWISATGGLIETPVIGLIDKITDYRWIQQNYLDQSKIVLNGNSFDNSADLGVRASIGIMKYVTFTGAFTNGAGYKANETNSYKSFTYLATINPIKEIYINGFGRNEITGKLDYTGKKTKKEYYGYGVAYMGDIIKIGFNHIFPYMTTVGLTQTNITVPGGGPTLSAAPLQRRGFMLLDSWVNFNLGGIIPSAPLLITGRFVYGLQRGTYQRALTDTELGKSRNTLLYALGIGWAFNKNFRLLLGGEIEQYKVKKNSLLAYNEGGSQNFYNASAVGAGPAFFVGSRNPHDTKRVYIKTEFVF